MTYYYSEFIEKNRPAPVTVPWTEVQAAAERLGLTVEPTTHGPGVRIRTDAANHVDFASAGEVALRYHPERGAQSVTYKVTITNSPGAGWSGADVPGLLTRELAARFAQDVVVPLPERVVKLPVPSWVRVVTNEPDPWLDSTEMFESEARAALGAFLTLAADVAGEGGIVNLIDDLKKSLAEMPGKFVLVYQDVDEYGAEGAGRDTRDFLGESNFVRDRSVALEATELSAALEEAAGKFREFRKEPSHYWPAYPANPRLYKEVRVGNSVDRFFAGRVNE